MLRASEMCIGSVQLVNLFAVCKKLVFGSVVRRPLIARLSSSIVLAPV